MSEQEKAARRAMLWERAERLRIFFATFRASLEAGRIVRAELARTMPAESLTWLDLHDFVEIEESAPQAEGALPRRAPGRALAKLQGVGA